MSPKNLVDRFNNNESILQTWDNGVRTLAKITIELDLGVKITIHRTNVEVAGIQKATSCEWAVLPNDKITVPWPVGDDQFEEDRFGQVWRLVAGFGLMTIFPPGLDPKEPLPVTKPA